MPVRVNERTGDPPEVVARVLDQTVEAAARALGDGLLSIVLFGSAAENRLRPTSDVNLLILVNRFDPTNVDAFETDASTGTRRYPAGRDVAHTGRASVCWRVVLGQIRGHRASPPHPPPRALRAKHAVLTGFPYME
jgi:hypothetical protein